MTFFNVFFRYEALAKIIVYSEDFYKFFNYVEVSTFDIASDAFSTFKVGSLTIYDIIMGVLSYRVAFFLLFQELLTRHKLLSAEFLEANYDKVFNHYQQLLNSENYVTRKESNVISLQPFGWFLLFLYFTSFSGRQSLKLLGELLLDRHNFTVSTTN